MLPEVKGLTTKKAKSLLGKYGKNTLPERPPPSDFSILLSQFKNPLVYVLLGAGFVTLSLGRLADTVLIVAGVIINTILGFIQERKADRSLYALKKLIHPSAKVLRDGKKKTIEASNIVPGDIVLLAQGDKVPADGKLVFSNRFFVNEAILTGEIIPVSKKESEKVFMGTIITSGQSMMEVVLTGEETKIGKIALSVQEVEEDTPLRRQLSSFSKQLAVLVGVLVFIVFIIGVATGKSVTDILVISVALAVSAIPEGLLVALTVVLAIGMQRILKHKGLVRSLLSAETLGGVTTICIDKTGTLTKGEMQVVEIVGKEIEIAKQMILANDLDDPLVIAAYDWARGKLAKPQALVSKYKRIDSLPFSSKNKYFVSLNKGIDETTLFVNGAPDVLLDLVKLERKEAKEIKNEIERLTKKGNRVIGLARKSLPSTTSKITNKNINELSWVGLLAFSDPIREGVSSAFEKTRKAGIKSIVITGDYPQTAINVMKQLGMEVNGGEIMLGEDLKSINTKDLAGRIDGGVKLFARTSPEQKMKIVKALKENGEVVAMMGDGVNDAPALKHADIGIVVGEATDVAKESADLVLLDSSFATIVASIEEGRGIFDNIRKIVLYLLSDAFEEIIVVIGSLLLSLPLPVSPAQILWINLVSDGFPDLALTVDPKSKGIMDRPPRSPKDKIVSKWMKALIALTSLTGGIIALSFFIFFYKLTGDEILARSVTFASLGVNSLVFVFSVRTLTDPFWKSNPFVNKWLNLAVLAGLIFQFIPFATPNLRAFFDLKFPGVGPIILVFGGSIITFIIIEVGKAIIRSRTKWFQH